MGIKGLSKLIADNAPSALREVDIKSLFNRKIAVDASMSMYQFLIAVRSDGPGGYGQLTNADGEVTSHLSGMFYRTIRLMENGIKPVYVFDGAAPTLKGGELEKRKQNREKAAEDLKKATEEDNKEDMDKLERRLVRVTRDQCAQVIKLFELMGVPVVQAPGEAEATCAAMAKANLVYATATEDMDALTFQTPVLVRHLMQSAARKDPIHEYTVADVLEELKITRDQFIDICILCGCDYTGSIRGVGPTRALRLIKEHKSIENVLKNLDTKKYIVPDVFLYKEARKLFVEPVVADCKEIKLEWKSPDEEGIIKYMVDEQGFNLDRMKSGIERLKKCKGKGTQSRLDSFFTRTVVKRKKPAKKSKKTKKPRRK
eukprot:112359_1